MAMKKKREIKVIVNFTDGWEERVVKAFYNLYLRLEAKEREEQAKSKSA